MHLSNSFEPSVVLSLALLCRLPRRDDDWETIGDDAKFAPDQMRTDEKRALPNLHTPRRWTKLNWREATTRKKARDSVRPKIGIKIQQLPSILVSISGVKVLSMMFFVRIGVSVAAQHILRSSSIPSVLRNILYFAHPMDTSKILLKCPYGASSSLLQSASR